MDAIDQLSLDRWHRFAASQDHELVSSILADIIVFRSCYVP
jgi:hypothetical protein